MFISASRETKQLAYYNYLGFCYAVNALMNVIDGAKDDKKNQLHCTSKEGSDIALDIYKIL